MLLDRPATSFSACLTPCAVSDDLRRATLPAADFVALQCPWAQRDCASRPPTFPAAISPSHLSVVAVGVMARGIP